jgi:peptidoglycan/LPS O-acetylase OafA/YrhL
MPRERPDGTVGDMVDQLARRNVSTALWSVGLGAATAATYGAFLAWDQHKDYDPATGQLSGPYKAWQVVGCGVVLAGLAFETGRRGRMWLASIVVPVVLTACFSVDAATGEDSDGLWPIGAGLVALGSFAGTLAVAALGARLAPRR